MEQNNIGSYWAKWDLHVHTPISHEQQYGDKQQDSTWDKYINDLAALPKEFKVIGINDYYTLDGYKKVKELENGRLSDRIILPVLELRLEIFGGISNEDKWRRINFHIIFDNESDMNLIQTNFLNFLTVECNLENGTPFRHNKLDENMVIKLGEAIINSTPENKRNITNPFEAGFNQLNFKHEHIFEVLEKSNLKYFTAIGKSEWDSMRWDNLSTAKKNIANKVDFIFTASENVSKYNNSKTKLEEASMGHLILLDCSDAHHHSNAKNSNGNLIKDRIGNCNNWIKSDTTFEGLRQALLLPNYRIQISDSKPDEPTSKINSIKFSFNDDIVIQRKNNPNTVQPFCFGNNDSTIHFSPYFTCIIGGRGSGKSTILNLIAYKCDEKSEFFEDNDLLDYKNNFKTKEAINQNVKIDGSTDIEFISQNDIQRYAVAQELTNAIYDERISKMIKYNFEELTTKIIQDQNEIHIQLKNIDNLIQKKRNKDTKEKELLNKSKIKEAYQDEKLTELNHIITNTTTKIDEIKKSQADFEKFKTDINIVLEKYPAKKNNAYDKQLQNKINEIKIIINKDFDFSAIIQELAKNQDEQDNAKKELNLFHQNRGTTPSNQSEYTEAVTSIPILESDIETLKSDIKQLENQYKTFQNKIADIQNNKTIFEKKLNIALLKMNTDLMTNNANVKEIRFEYIFNEEFVKSKILDEFQNMFQEHKENTKKETLERFLFTNGSYLHGHTNYEDFKDALSKMPDYTNAFTFLTRTFESEDNFNKYQLLCLKHFNNPLSQSNGNGFMQIKGRYAGRALESCSFGQRCTAIIVALLTFGTKPLLIDEPEAHLDSKLIADYLVELIKKRKIERQIIFATHNANFVINGDAELIHILEIPDTENLTQITSTTIENLTHRDKLLNLEGGEEAFKKREKRLIK